MQIIEPSFLQLPRELNCLIFDKLTAKGAANLCATTAQLRNDLDFRKMQALRSYGISEAISLVIEELKKFSAELNKQDWGSTLEEIGQTKSILWDQLEELPAAFEMAPNTKELIDNIKGCMLEQKALLLTADCEHDSYQNLEQTSVHQQYYKDLVFKNRLSRTSGNFQAPHYGPEIVATLFSPHHQELEAYVQKCQSLENSHPIRNERSVAQQGKGRKCAVM